ncbi:hypothetical protein KSS87_019031 [Heliosperma pusillum]|nr:hypothetical protein KSS87_019031 [Heliosperma pusillum]
MEKSLRTLMRLTSGKSKCQMFGQKFIKRLGCLTVEIAILPPHKAKNKGSGKRQMSSKEKDVRKTEKRKRRCGNCKRKIEMSNVWSEFYKTVGLLDSGELKNMKEFSKLPKQFRETMVGAVEKKSKNKEIEDLLGCKAPQEIDILPPQGKEQGKWEKTNVVKREGCKENRKEEEKVW